LRNQIVNNPNTEQQMEVVIIFKDLFGEDLTQLSPDWFHPHMRMV
jgi:hypothetical protein